MECEIFLAASRAQLQAGHIECTSIPLADFDIQRMRQGYYNEKKALVRGFDQFAERWQRDWSRLPRPQAGLVGWSREELARDFIPTFAAQEEELGRTLAAQCRLAYAVVWTIGPALEEEAFSQVQSGALQAMFLDVAGSLLMGQLRTALHRLVSGLAGQAQADLAVLGEHIPEISEQDPRLRRIAAPWAEARLRPDFSLKPNGVLHPLKSQCAMFFLGQPQPGQSVGLNELPCSHCKGSKCLYLQFGGCHLPARARPSRPTSAG